MLISPMPHVVKLEQLRRYLEDLCAGGIAIAFSGGVDSALLLRLLQDIKKKKSFKLIALYVHSSIHPSRDLSFVKTQAGGVDLHIEHTDPLSISEVRFNTKSRCYHCKKAIFSRLLTLAHEAGCGTLLDGTNADDMLVYRPGKQAIRELGIISPLAQLGISKQEVRAMAASLGLVTASRPSTPCLATRFDYDVELSTEELRRAEAGEAYLRDLLGAEVNLRLRVHLPQQLARIEIDATAMPQLLEQRDDISQHLRGLGYKQIALDLQGFRSGSMDESDS